MAIETPVTLDALPGEGKQRTTIESQERQGCEMCGEPAHFRHTYLLENYRRNKASSAYGRDDCSWCSDMEVFVCRSCKPDAQDGYEQCSIFPANERFAHLFLYWRKNAVNELEPTESV